MYRLCDNTTTYYDHIITFFSLFLFKASEGKKKLSLLFCFLKRKFCHTPTLTWTFNLYGVGNQLMMNNFNLLSFQVISNKIRSIYVAALITGNGVSTGSKVLVRSRATAKGRVLSSHFASTS